MRKIKINDEVIILAGKDKGKKGSVLSLNWKRGKALVKGINMVHKATRPSEGNPSGGFVDVERPIDLSNIALISPKTLGPTRVRIEQREGKKVRVAVKCGNIFN